MSFQNAILADLVRDEHAADVAPARLERRRAARLLEAVARCCRTSLAGRIRAALARPARTQACCASA